MRTIFCLLGLVGFVESQCPLPPLPITCGALTPGTALAAPNVAAPDVVALPPGTTNVNVVILGHSESRRYHQWLGPLLNQNPPVPGTSYTVVNEYIGGHQAYRWATPGQAGYQRIDTVLSQYAQDPLIILGLFSNNVTFPIQSPTPGNPNFERFLSDLESIVDHLHAGGNGTTMVYLSAHRYKPSNLLPCWYENCAMPELFSRLAAQGKGYAKPGPEQHQLHRCCFPQCYAPDLAHTNVAGEQLMAEAWYRLLWRELRGCGVDAYGEGSPAAGGSVPILGTAGELSLLGNSSFVLEVDGAVPGAFVFYAVGTDVGSGPLLVDPITTVIPGGTANAAGVHTLPLPLPAAPSLAGLVAHVQAGFFAPGTSLGAALTQGLEIRLCP